MSKHVRWVTRGERDEQILAAVRKSLQDHLVGSYSGTEWVEGVLSHEEIDMIMDEVREEITK